MSDTNDDLVAQFRDITGVDAERARFFLEASGWQLQLATQSFFDSEGDADVEGMVQDQDSDPEVDAETRQRFEQNLAGMLRQMTGGAAAAAAAGAGVPAGAPKPKKEKKPAGPRTGFMTLDGLRNQESDDDSSDDEDKGQAYYAGGSQTSGQQVLGPPRRRDELVAEMFKKAKEHGAQEVEGPPQMIKRKAPSGGGGGGAFSGAGYKLGDSNEGAEAVGSSSSNATNANTESREVVLRLWSTGFTVNDGPLRSYQDSANLEFLAAVKRGEVPRELIREYQGQEVEMTMEDKRHEDYAPPRNQVKAFAGKGQTLGSPAPATVGSAAPLTDGDRKANETAAREQVPLADGAPTTNIQFRLVDGTRLIARFNPTHTVNDLHCYINVARPQFATANYVLTLFPNTELTDKAQTLESAKLSNAALIQKIKQ